MLDPEKLKICVHCGLCLEACPTYRVLKNEADSPRGRIALMRGVIEARIPMSETVLSHLDACLDCRACETACPAGVPYGELIEEGRSQLYPQVSSFKTKGRLTRFFLTQILGKPNRLKVLSHLLKIYQRIGLQRAIRKSGILNLCPAWMKQGEALLPEIPFLGRSLKADPSAATRPPPAFAGVQDDRKARIALLRGCIASILFPQVEEATIGVLQALGCSVTFPEEQACCGALLLHGGFKEDAVQLAKKNVEAFSRGNYDFIVVTAAGCGSTLKEYERILPESQKAQNFSKKITDVTQIIAHLGIQNLPLKPLPLRVAYQDACHLAHAQGIREEPRQVLKAIPELELLDLPNSDWCCGSAGIYNLTHPELANQLLQQKIEDIVSVKPDVVAVGNPGCALQIQMGLKQNGWNIPVLHPIELLTKSLSD